MKILKKSLAIGLLGCASTVLSAVTYAGCVTSSCVNTTYFSEPERIIVVGTHSTCSGMKGLRGEKTSWFEREADTTRWCEDNRMEIPCHFSEKGC